MFSWRLILDPARRWTSVAARRSHIWRRMKHFPAFWARSNDLRNPISRRRVAGARHGCDLHGSSLPRSKRLGAFNTLTQPAIRDQTAILN